MKEGWSRSGQDTFHDLIGTGGGEGRGKTYILKRVYEFVAFGILALTLVDCSASLGTSG